MNKRRRRDMIIAQILEICNDGANKTRVVYASNINFKLVTLYLDKLINNGLIEKLEGRPTLYKTTKKGLETLENLKALQDLISGV
jgi:predicted transcriptional regulator